jgi:hypothetical protein
LHLLCSSPDATALGAAIDRRTHALGTAHDTVIPALVAERAALREELRALRDASANVVRLAEQTARSRR